MLRCLPDAVSPGLLYRPGWPHALCPVHGQVTEDRLCSDISCRAWAQGDFLIANLLEGLAVLTFSEPDPANRDWKLHKACLHWCHRDRPCHLRVRNRRPKRRKKCRWREWDSRRRWAASMSCTAVANLGNPLSKNLQQNPNPQTPLILMITYYSNFILL